MRLSQARGKIKDLAVDFDGEILNITYRPAQYTVADLEEIQGRPDNERMRATVDLFIETVKSWDLEYDPEDGTGIIPLVPDVLSTKVPVQVMVKVLNAVQKETAPSAEA